MKYVKIIILILTLFCFDFLMVKAQDMPVLFFKTNEINSYFNYISYGRAKFYKNGFITVNNDEDGAAVFEYYSLEDGKLLKDASPLPATQSIIDIEVIDDNIYVLTSANGSIPHNLYDCCNLKSRTNEIIKSVYLYKLDDDFNVIKFIYIDIEFDIYDLEDSDYGYNFIEYNEEGIYIKNYLFDNNLNEISNNYPYFNMFTYNDLDLMNASDDFCKENGIYWSKDSDYGSNVIAATNYSHIVITFRDNEKINNSIISVPYEYENFDDLIIFKDMVVVNTVHSFDENASTYFGDLLFYDFYGNYIGKIEYDNSRIYYLETDGNYLIVNTKKMDNICSYDSYYYVNYVNDGGCSSISNTYVYGYKDLKNTEEVLDDVIEIANPTTFSNKEYVILLILIGSFASILLIYVGRKVFK